jgi:hypothetical protein
MSTVDPRTLGMNLWLLLGALLAAGFALIVLIAFWTSIKIGIFRWRQRRAEAAYRAQRVHPDGSPRPPASAGVRSQCDRLHRQVYHLPDGRRLCPDDYAAQHGS